MEVLARALRFLGLGNVDSSPGLGCKEAYRIFRFLLSLRLADAVLWRQVVRKLVEFCVFPSLVSWTWGFFFALY